MSDWYEVYNNICNWSITLSDIEDKNIINMLDEQKKTINNKFCKFVLDNYKGWINDSDSSDDTPVLSYQIFNISIFL